MVIHNNNIVINVNNDNTTNTTNNITYISYYTLPLCITISNYHCVVAMLSSCCYAVKCDGCYRINCHIVGIVVVVWAVRYAHAGRQYIYHHVM